MQEIDIADESIIDRITNTKIYKITLTDSDGNSFDMYNVTDLQDNSLNFNDIWGRLFAFVRHFQYDAYPKTGQVKLLFDTALNVENWLLCDGRVVLQATYPSLYAKISTTYNDENTPVDSFKLPLMTTLNGFNYYIYSG